jgi:hypothetical protein
MLTISSSVSRRISTDVALPLLSMPHVEQVARNLGGGGRIVESTWIRVSEPQIGQGT